MSKYQVHVFISHSWSYSDVYDQLHEWIFEPAHRFGQASLDFRNFSVPKDNPISNPANNKQLKMAIKRKIAPCHVIIVPTGRYINHSQWIRFEIKVAQKYNKPILAVDPWGQQRASRVVTDAAYARVGWNRGPLVKTIWDIYYGKL